MKKRLLVVLLLILTGGFDSCGGGSSTSGSNPAFTGDCTPLPLPNATTAFSAAFKTRLDKFAMKRCYAKQGWQRDAERRTSQKIHDTRIQMYYSPSLYKWMVKDKRQGPVPDGAIAIKEEFDTTDADAPIAFWSVMIKASSLWW